MFADANSDEMLIWEGVGEGSGVQLNVWRGVYVLCIYIQVDILSKVFLFLVFAKILEGAVHLLPPTHRHTDTHARARVQSLNMSC